MIILEKSHLHVDALAGHVEPLVQVSIAQGKHLDLGELAAVCIVHHQVLRDAPRRIIVILLSV